MGQSVDVYSFYCKCIRREYSWVDDLSYNAGRLKVLEYFFDMISIFKTQFFISKFEVNARKNIAAEIEIMKKNNNTF